jgi:hypothetical protein
VIYSLIHIVQFGARFMQEQRYWHHNKNKNIGRCILYSWWSMVGLLSQSKWLKHFKPQSIWHNNLIIAFQFASSARPWCSLARPPTSPCSLRHPFCKAWVFRPFCSRSALLC